jgi:outer membrane protein, heavy metal efflux system
MTRPPAWMSVLLICIAVMGLPACVGFRPMPNLPLHAPEHPHLGTAILGGGAWLAMYPAGIRVPTAPPTLPPPPEPPARLLQPPREVSTTDPDDEKNNPAVLPHPRLATDSGLGLDEVLVSVERHFPLLVSAELERQVAAGQRLSAAGAFDTNLRAVGATQGGTFPSNRFNLGIEQPTLTGATLFAGYRFGYGDFPVYYGDRQTADGGEFRGGVQVPLLRDAAIDRRRAQLRQAQLNEALAEPVVQRARIDYFRAAARSYWGWVGAGTQVLISEELLRIARERQAGLEEQFRKGQIPEFVVIDNQRLIAEREGALIASERRWQQAGYELSLYLRDERGDPIVPGPERMPRSFPDWEPQAPDPTGLRNDIALAYQQRPEMVRFQVLKERATVELRLAENQQLPALNAGLAGTQDAGPGKRATGTSALDRSTIEGSLTLEVPLQRRDSLGRQQTSRALLMQLLAQERFARDQIAAEVQDAVSSLDRAHARLERARAEARIAQRVSELELDRFQKGQGTLLEVNLREIAAAGARSRVIDALADYFRAVAEYRAALGLDAQPPPSR